MSNIEDVKIMGIIPKSKYVHFTYMFLLISAAGNALFSLFSMLGLGFTSGVYGAMVMGVLSLILAVIGLSIHKAEFSAHDHTHFKYIGALFVVFFVINIIFGAIYAISFFLGYLCTIALSVVQTVLVWTGYSSWQDGRVITKDNIKGEVKLALAKR